MIKNIKKRIVSWLLKDVDLKQYSETVLGKDLADAGLKLEKRKELVNVESDLGSCNKNLVVNCDEESEDNPDIIIVNGKKDVLEGHMKNIGIGYATYYKRLRRGESPEEALSYRKEGDHVVLIDGHKDTISNWLKKIGITYDAYCYRLDSGYGVKKALTFPNQHDKRYRGRADSLLGHCKRLGREKDYSLIYRRIKKGWSLKDALEIPAGNGKSIEYGGVVDSLIGHCRRLGKEKDYDLIQCRIQRGWSIEDAFRNSKSSYNKGKSTGSDL